MRAGWWQSLYMRAGSLLGDPFSGLPRIFCPRHFRIFLFICFLVFVVCCVVFVFVFYFCRESWCKSWYMSWSKSQFSHCVPYIFQALMAEKGGGEHTLHHSPSRNITPIKNTKLLLTSQGSFMSYTAIMG